MVGNFFHRNKSFFRTRNMKNYCFQNGVVLNAIYEDIASGMRFKREKLMSLLRELINYRIEKVIISHKDRLSRIGFELFYDLVQEFSIMNRFFSCILSLWGLVSKDKTKIKLVRKESKNVKPNLRIYS